MNLNYTELKQSCNNIRETFTIKGDWYPGKIQKIFSSGSYLIFSIRVPGETIYLSIGRGNENSGVWLSDGQVPSPYRIVKDRLLEFLRSNTLNKRIVSIRVDEDDKCVEIGLTDNCFIMLFFKGRSVHFSYIDKSNKDGYDFSPWTNLKKDHNEFEENFEIFDRAGRKNFPKNKKSRIDKYILFTENEFISVNNSSKKKSKQDVKIEKIKEDLARCMLWKEVQAEVKREDLILDENRYKYKSFKIKFNFAENFHQKRDLIFQKTKRLKRGESILRERLEKEKAKLTSNVSNDVVQKTVFPIWLKNQKTQVKQDFKESDIAYINTISNFKIAIGLNAKANDRIRKEWAKKNDLWFHIDGVKSGHMFVKGIDTVNYKLAQVLGSLLAEHSGYDSSEIPIIYTKVSNLKGVKGIAGTVNYKKEKHLVIQRVNWKEIISTGW